LLLGAPLSGYGHRLQEEIATTLGRCPRHCQGHVRVTRPGAARGE
jgi:hypothetical protein